MNPQGGQDLDPCNQKKYEKGRLSDTRASSQYHNVRQSKEKTLSGHRQEFSALPSVDTTFA